MINCKNGKTTLESEIKDITEHDSPAVIEKYRKILLGESFTVKDKLFTRKNVYEGEKDCVVVETNTRIFLKPDGRISFKNGEVDCQEFTRLSEIIIESDSLIYVKDAFMQSGGYRSIEDFLQGLTKTSGDEMPKFELLGVAL